MTERIPVGRIHGLIEEAKRIPSIERVVFTGGECFLLGRDLDALVAHAHELALETRVISNGYWAVSEDAARTRVASLGTAGLTQMMLSTGTYHQRFVPVDRIVHAARAAASAAILVRISIEDCDQQTFDDTVLRDALEGEIAARRVFLGRDPWIADAGGRGESRLSHDAILAQGGERQAHGRCTQILDVITVSPDQQLLACCGFPLEQLPRLRIGSLAEAPLDELLLAAPDELLKMWLHIAGPHGIAEFVALHLPGFKLPPTPSICQSCVALQRDDRAMAVVSRHAGEVAQAIVSKFVELNGGCVR